MKISATCFSPRARPCPARSLNRQGGAINSGSLISSGTQKTETCTNHQSQVGRPINSLILTTFAHRRRFLVVMVRINVTMVRHFMARYCSAKETTVRFFIYIYIYLFWQSWLSRLVSLRCFVFPQFARGSSRSRLRWFWSPHHRRGRRGLKGDMNERK